MAEVRNPKDGSIVNLNADGSLEPRVVKFVNGEVKKITPSFICIQPIKSEFQSKQPLPVMSQNIYFKNGKIGSFFKDLTESPLELDMIMKTNLVVIDNYTLILSAWEEGAKVPQNDELKAKEYANEIRKKKQKQPQTSQSK